MTLAALMLAPRVFQGGIPEWLKYGALGVLFVNISIGGTLTSFAAPPVLMVASVWQWDSAYMASHFGWKCAIAVFINASVVTMMLRRHLVDDAVPVRASRTSPGTGAATSADTHGASAAKAHSPAVTSTPPGRMPPTVILVHLGFLAGVVAFAHHPVIFLGLFLMFLGYTQAYERYQSPLIIKEALLVAFFLAGLVVLGGLQQWWLQPIVAGLAPKALFFGALGLTAITDNAALTYLGAQIDGLADAAKYMLVAGAVAGGGLTVIANAPNPAGVALLRKGFADESIGTIGLLLGALAPTAVAAVMLLVF
jgi:hypothetical protein